MDKLKNKILLFFKESSSLEDFFNKIDSLTSEEKEKSADILLKIGNEFYFKSNWKIAIKFYEKALAIYKEFKDKKGESTCYNNIGAIYDDLGDYDKALDYYNRSLEISKAIGDRKGESTCYNNIGLIYDNLGEYAKALDYYNRSLEIRKAIGDRKGESRCYNNIGLIYYNLGENDKALDYYNRSLEIRKAIGDRRGEIITRINLGLLLATLKRFAEAENQAILAERKINELNLKDYPFGKEMMKFIEKIKNKKASEEDLKEFESLIKKLRT